MVSSRNTVSNALILDIFVSLFRRSSFESSSLGLEGLSSLLLIIYVLKHADVHLSRVRNSALYPCGSISRYVSLLNAHFVHLQQLTSAYIVCRTPYSNHLGPREAAQIRV